MSRNETFSEEDDRADVEKIRVGIVAMVKKVNSKPMKQILNRLRSYAHFEILIFAENVILNEPIEGWPRCDCLISFFSEGFPLSKVQAYASLFPTFLINDLDKQWDIMDRTKVYQTLKEAGIEHPRYAIKIHDKSKLIEQEHNIYSKYTYIY